VLRSTARLRRNFVGQDGILPPIGKSAFGQSGPSSSVVCLKKMTDDKMRSLSY
jgi:hypothetical protein